MGGSQSQGPGHVFLSGSQPRIKQFYFVILIIGLIRTNSRVPLFSRTFLNVKATPLANNHRAEEKEDPNSSGSTYIIYQISSHLARNVGDRSPDERSNLSANNDRHDAIASMTMQTG
ncbi:hypothetical protein JTE90_021189 [Oedothorax gibbosus]|uniref:Uncharacterized protein n=1 Tax=Oedothorax gibbosus TaxID=931172 RepID=A0AAV6V534_9ARAC|nr:hypothetical protein JTE90_021189 [Oedothorax gibbosus]